MAPLCWKANEWIGLSFACSIQSVLDSLRALVHWDGGDEPVVSIDHIKQGIVDLFLRISQGFLFAKSYSVCSPKKVLCNFI